MSTTPYPLRLLQGVREKLSPICLGLDPRPDLMPEECWPGSRRDAGAAAEAAENFGLRLLEALAPHAAAVKVQIAFYEALGIRGLEAYQRTLKEARRRGLIAIADVKRGDIASTAEAYAAAHLAPGAPFEADAVTLSPWLGHDSLEPFLGHCQKAGKGVYLLLHTSNPGSKDVQELPLADGTPLYRRLAVLMAGWQRDLGGEGMSPLGAVVGATYPTELADGLALLPRAPFLVPGYGAQGAGGREVACLYARGPAPHLVNASRSLIYSQRENGQSFEDGAIAAALAMKAEIGRFAPALAPPPSRAP